MLESRLYHQHLELQAALNQRHLLIMQVSLRRAAPSRRVSHCMGKEEVVQWKDQKAFRDSHTTDDPCRNLKRSHYVSAGLVATTARRDASPMGSGHVTTSFLPKLIVPMLNVLILEHSVLVKDAGSQGLKMNQINALL